MDNQVIQHIKNAQAFIINSRDKDCQNANAELIKALQLCSPEKPEKKKTFRTKTKDTDSE
jgi:hypothetical protein